MSGIRKSATPSPKKENRDRFSEILDFGPEAPREPTDEFTRRLKQIIKKLQDINQRIDALCRQTP